MVRIYRQHYYCQDCLFAYTCLKQYPFPPHTTRYHTYKIECHVEPESLYLITVVILLSSRLSII